MDVLTRLRGAVAFDCYAWKHFPMNLTIEESKKLANWGLVFIGFILPIIIFGVFRRSFTNGKRGTHEKASLLIVWLLLILYAIWTTPIRIAYAESLESPDSWSRGMHDGTGMNSGVIVFGWVLPFFSLLIFSGISALIRSVRNSIRSRHPGKIA